jgi:hypothetical protein
MDRRDFLKYSGAGLTGLAVRSFDSPLFSLMGASPSAWKFGVMADTQWRTGSNSGGEPGSCAVSVIHALNSRFIRHGVKFVIQVGDLVDRESVNGSRALPVRAAAAQALYDAGIGFFPVRGNHESSETAANEIPELFPQTMGSGPNVYGAGNFLSQPNENLRGLTYSFDYENVRCVLIDQFVRKDGSNYDGAGSYTNNTIDQVPWVDNALVNRPSGTHAFVFSHKNLIGQNHKDVLFGSRLDSNPEARNFFITSLMHNGVRYHISGHDHMHHRSRIQTDPEYERGPAHVGQIICSSNSYKFYTPREGDDGREISFGQELYTLGYYIVTVDGPRVTVDFYSSSHGSDYGNINLSDPPGKYAFYLRETFGYSLNGKEFLVKQGEPYTAVQDAYQGTAVRILSGKNNSLATDYVGDPLEKTITTGWSSKTIETESSILTLWGMSDNLCLWDDPERDLDIVGLFPNRDASRKTDAYTLLMTYEDEQAGLKHPGNAEFRLSTRDADGKWVNAVDGNFGGGRKFVQGPFESGRHDLGTYGMDTHTKSVWAVINHSNSEFAVTRM